LYNVALNARVNKLERVAYSRERMQYESDDPNKLFWYLRGRHLHTRRVDFSPWGRYIKSGFVPYLFLAYLFFTLVAVLWIVIFKYIWNPTEFVNTYYSHIGVGLLTVVVGYIYYNWAGECTARFERTATYYHELTAKVWNIASTISGVLPKSIDLHKRVRTENASRKQPKFDESIEIDAKNIVQDIQILLCALESTIEHVFTCDPRHVSDPERKCLYDLALTQQLFREVADISPDIARAHRHAPYACSGHYDQPEYADVLLLVIMRRLHQLKHTCLIDSADMTTIQFSISEYRTHFDSAMAFLYVYSYRMYQSFFFIVLSVYFLFIPLLQWESFDSRILIVYPPTVFIIAGVFIISRWLGNPFEGNSEHNHIDHRYKTREMCRRIYQLFARYCKAPEHILDESVVVQLEF